MTKIYHLYLFTVDTRVLCQRTSPFLMEIYQFEEHTEQARELNFSSKVCRITANLIDASEKNHRAINQKAKKGNTDKHNQTSAKCFCV